MVIPNRGVMEGRKMTKTDNRKEEEKGDGGATPPSPCIALWLGMDEERHHHHHWIMGRV